MGKVYLISDTHLKHSKVATYCQRPENFTELIDERVKATVGASDFLIHVGDVGIDKANGPDGFMKTVAAWPGKKFLVRGNHDHKSALYYMSNGFDWAGDALLFRGVWFTHHPWTDPLPAGANVNVHGHLHNVWDGFGANDPNQVDEFAAAYRAGRLPREYNRLLAVEYTDYRPVEMDKFLQKPDKYQARGPNAETLKRVALRLEQERKDDPNYCGTCPHN